MVSMSGRTVGIAQAKKGRDSMTRKCVAHDHQQYPISGTVQ